MLAAVYGHDGMPKVSYESLALYGGVLGYFKATDSGIASDIVRTKLRPLYNQAHNTLTTRLSYYDNNWVWFGLALYEGRLPNLAGQRSSA
jgi:endoglucanase